jgi:hypothetical protein
MRILALILALLIPAQALAWTVTKNFDGGTAGSLATGTYGFDYAGTETKFSTAQVRSGKSVAFGHIYAQDDWGKAHAEFNYPSVVGIGGQIWLRTYMYFPSDFSWDSYSSGNVIKVLRIARVATTSDSHVGWLSVFANKAGEIMFSNEIDGTPTGENTTGVQFTKGGWQCIEISVKLSKTSPIFRIWKNGTLIYNNTSLGTTPADTGYQASVGYLFSTWNGSAPANQTNYIDDMVWTSDTPSNVDANGYPMIGPDDWGGADTTPPVRSAGSPSGALSAGTTSTTMSLTTNENATCKWSTSAGTAYGSMANTFSTTGGTSHSTTISGLTNGGSYTRYVRCSDAVPNVNTDDYTISWTVSSPATPTKVNVGSVLINRKIP